MEEERDVEVEFEIEMDDELIESIEHFCGRKLTDEELGLFVAAILKEQITKENDWKEWLDKQGDNDE